MAANIANIHIGQGEIWVGGTPPAAGGDPNDPTTSSLNFMLTGYSAPNSGGAYIGFTNGPATLVYHPTYYEVETEQAFAPVVNIPTNEEATLNFTASEQSYTNLATAIGQGTTKVTGGGTPSNAIYVGSKAVTVLKTFVMHSRKRSGVGYFILTMYSAYSQNGLSLNFERRTESRNSVTLKSLADLTRPIGDQLFQFVEYTTAP